MVGESRDSQPKRLKLSEYIGCPMHVVQICSCHACWRLWYGDAGEEPDSKQRRLNLIKAVEGDDWSAVIDSQTQQTIEGMLVADVSPFGL